jgi:hypothetical protein
MNAHGPPFFDIRHTYMVETPSGPLAKMRRGKNVQTRQRSERFPLRRSKVPERIEQPGSLAGDPKLAGAEAPSPSAAGEPSGRSRRLMPATFVVAPPKSLPRPAGPGHFFAKERDSRLSQGLRAPEHVSNGRLL